MFFVFWSGFHFPIRELVEPSEIVGLCMRKRDSDLAIRYKILSFIFYKVVSLIPSFLLVQFLVLLYIT